MRYQGSPIIYLAIVFVGLTSGLLRAQTPEPPSSASTGQVVYVPVYSHVYFGDREREYNLSSTLLIRNVSQTDTIIVTAVKYFNSQGELVRQYGNTPKVLVPLQSTWYIVRENDRAGGAGANFIVHWSANSPALPPMIETVNIGTAFGQGISSVRDLYWKNVAQTGRTNPNLLHCTGQHKLWRSWTAFSRRDLRHIFEGRIG